MGLDISGGTCAEGEREEIGLLVGILWRRDRDFAG